MLFDDGATSIEVFPTSYAVAADIFHFKLMQGMKAKGMKMK